MIIIYGSSQCPDTQACLNACKEKGLSYSFQDLAELSALKAFLSIRDSDSMYDEVKQAGGVGIPLVVKEDGARTLDWESAI